MMHFLWIGWVTITSGYTSVGIVHKFRKLVESDDA